MKVLLSNIPSAQPRDGRYAVKAGSRWPHLEDEGAGYVPFPFFLAYAAAVLEQAGIDVRIVDAVAEAMDVDRFLEVLAQWQPELLVVETSTTWLENDLAVAARVKAATPAVRLALCGPHAPMYEPAFLDAHPEVDVVLVGEYEHTLRDLVLALEQGADLASVDGIAYRDASAAAQQTPRREPIADLDALPWPHRATLPMDRYNDNPFGMPRPCGILWASRGCPFQCIFCSWPKTMYGGHTYRTRSPKDIADEMEALVRDFGCRSLYFDDDNFNVRKSHLLGICDEVRSRGLDVPWGVMARADTMDADMLAALHDAGLCAVKYGVESGVQAILDRSGKRLSLADVEATVAETKRLGIQVHLTFTFGLPGETHDTIRQTIAYARRLDPDTAQFSIVTPFPGSPYFEQLERDGQLIERDWSRYDGSSRAVFRTPELSGADLEAAVCRAHEAWDRHVRGRVTRNDMRRHPWAYAAKALCHPWRAMQELRKLFAKSN